MASHQTDAAIWVKADTRMSFGKPYGENVYSVPGSGGCPVSRVPVLGGPRGGRDFVGQCPRNKDASFLDELESPRLNLMDVDMLVVEDSSQKCYCQTLWDDERQSEKRVTEPY